jgi:hypothetical protein
LLLAVASAVLLLPAPLHAEDALPTGGVEAGVGVVLPAADGPALAALTNKGRLLVHGLALDDDQRDRARAGIIDRKVYRLATAVTWPQRKIVLGDGGRVGGQFAFTPDEEEGALQKRLSEPQGWPRVPRTPPGALFAPPTRG